MISDLYKADMPSWIERTKRGIPRDYNVPPVTKIGGDIGDETASTDVSIITITTSSPVATKADTRSTNRQTTRVTRSTTSISSKHIRYTRNLRLQSRRSTGSKR